MSEFTPMEHLVIEVLIARHRLGELLWTFDKSAKRCIENLAAKGWVDSMNGIVENSVRARLTSKGRARWLSYPYNSPNEVAGADDIVEDATRLKERFGGDEFWIKGTE